MYVGMKIAKNSCYAHHMLDKMPNREILLRMMLYTMIFKVKEALVCLGDEILRLYVFMGL